MSRADREVVLLTGFPSFSARKMCEELLAAPEPTFVHALVRSDDLDDARAALDALPLEQRQRVAVVVGDTAAIDFGLSRQELAALTAEIDVIHHLAQVTRADTSGKTAHAVNVRGAREVTEIAALCPRLRCLVHHSSATVSGDRSGLVLEAELDRDQRFRSEIEATFAHGERVVRQKMAKLPIAVLRPTFVVGDATTGEVEPDSGASFLFQFVLGSPPELPLPLPGRGESPLHLVPIDYVVKVARAIGRDARALGRTFHVGDPSPRSARRVFELIASAGGRPPPRGFLPSHLTKALLRAPGLDRVAPRAFLDALATPVSYSFASTTELLAGTGITCPPFESYVERLVASVRGTG